MSKSEPGTVWKRAFFLAVAGIAVIAMVLGVAALLMLRGTIPETLAGGSLVLVFAFLGTLLLGLFQPGRKGGKWRISHLLAPVGILLLFYVVLAFLMLPEGPELVGFLRGAVAIGLGFGCGTLIKINKTTKAGKKKGKKYTKSNRKK